MRKTSRGYTEGQHGADRTLIVGGVYGAFTFDWQGRQLRHMMKIQKFHKPET